MNLRPHLVRLWAYERAVVILSFWLAVTFFVVALVWGNVASLLRDTPSLSFVDAGLWFIRALMLGVFAGTVLNIVGFVVSAARRAR
jgi:hypothetical protein